MPEGRMNNEPTPGTAILPTAESASAAPEPSGLHKAFFGPDGLRAGWRLAIYLAVVFGLQYLIIQRGLRLIPGVAEIMKQAQSSGVLTPRFELIFESTAILIVFLAAGIMSRIEKRSLGVYGLAVEGRSGNYSGRELCGDWVSNHSRCWRSSR